jgi:hypothetical protein
MASSREADVPKEWISPITLAQFRLPVSSITRLRITEDPSIIKSNTKVKAPSAAHDEQLEQRAEKRTRRVVVNYVANIGQSRTDSW